jgi:DNA topoisomerase-3
VVSAIGGRYAGLLAPLTPSRPLGSRTVDALDDKKLSRAMRDSGLGTPATRAETIETLIRHGYLAREGRSLAATDKGVRLIGVVHPHVKSPAMTGEWEAFL